MIKKKIKLPSISPLVISISIVGLCAFLRIALIGDLGLRLAYIAFFPAVILSTLAGGLVAGLLATTFSSLFVVFWHMPDGQQFLNDAMDWIGLGDFIFNGIVISIVSWRLILAKSSKQKVALIEEQQILNSIVNHVPAMIAYWNNDLTNKFANSAYIEWFGIEPEKLRGKHIREMLGNRLFAQNKSYIEAVLRGEPQAFERAITDVKGRERFAHASYLPDIADGQVKGFFVLVTDITELKLAQQRIAQSEASLRAMYDNLPFLAWMKDTKGYYVLANKHWLESAKHTDAKNLYGKTDFDFWPKELAEHYRAVDNEVMQTRQQKN